MPVNVVKYKQSELLDYKQDIINILSTQIKVLEAIENKILIHEKNYKPDDKDYSKLLTPSKSAEFREILKGEISKIENFDVVLAVVGTMKAGKSTTINSIVGREILPNRNRPMTALPTLICHNPQQIEPKLTFQNFAINNFLQLIRNKLAFIPDFESNVSETNELINFITSKNTFSNEYHGSENIFLFLQRLNDLVRLTSELNAYLMDENIDNIEFPYQEYRNIDQLPIIEVAFNTINSDFNTQGRFMLLDTPGPNEAGQSELKVMLREQLERSSAVLLVLDYTQLNSEAEADVKSQISEIPTIQKSRLFAVVNKFDQKRANSDDEPETINHVYHNLLRDMIEKNHIFPISAQDAYLASRMKTYLETNRQPPKFQFGTWIEDFADVAYGRKIEERYVKADKDEILELIDEVIDDSKTKPLLSNVISKMHINAPTIAIQSALIGSSKVFNDLHNFFSIRTIFTEKEKLTDKEIDELQKSIDELNQQRNGLKIFNDNTLAETKSYTEKTFAEILNNIKDIEEDVILNIDTIFSNNSKNQDAPKREKYRNFLLSNKDSEEYEQEFEANLRESIQKDQDENTILFTNEHDSQKFLNEDIGHLLENLQKNVESEFRKLKRNMQRQTNKKFKTIEIRMNNILDNIQDEFKKSNIDIVFDFKVSSKSNKLFNESIKLNDIKVSHHNRTVTVRQPGLKGGMARIVGKFFNNDWGYKKITTTTYKIDKEKLVSALKQIINEEVFKPVKKELNNEKARVEDIITSKIRKIEETCNELIQEFEFCIEQEKIPDLEKKFAYKQQLNDLSYTYKNTYEDWNRLAFKFDIKALSN